MRWFTHKSVALAGAAWLGVSLPGLAGVALGSILPDSIDMSIAGRNRSLFQRIHRGPTHWMGWYFILILLGQALIPLGLSPEDLIPAWRKLNLPPGSLADLISGIGLGGLSHVLLDALNPSGVPLRPWTKKPRLSLNMVSTGSWGERVFLICALVLLGAQCSSLRELLAAALR